MINISLCLLDLVLHFATYSHLRLCFQFLVMRVKLVFFNSLQSLSEKLPKSDGKFQMGSFKSEILKQYYIYALNKWN